VTIQTLSCTGDVKAKSITCVQLKPDAGGASADVIIGGPNNLYVKVTSANVDYSAPAQQLTFDVTVRNLIGQPIGTTNGVALDPAGVRIFFLNGVNVTSGAGAVTIVADGTGTFTHAGQEYYQYSTVLDPLEVSAPKTWTLQMPPSVNTFQFELAVSTAVEYPNGYVDVTGNTSVRSGLTRQLTATVYDYLGNIVAAPGPITWGTADPLLATVSSTGLLKGLRAGTVEVTASTSDAEGPIPSRDYQETVRPIRRLWTGAAGTTDWFTGANWLPDSIVPVPADTALVVDSVGATVFPVLTANASIGGVEVDDVTPGGTIPTINLAAFNLTASGDVFTTNSSSISSSPGQLVLTGVARTMRGLLPRTNVTGTYSLNGNATIAQRIQVQGGRITSTSFRLQQNP
jgi:hypothetical protein